MKKLLYFIFILLGMKAIQAQEPLMKFYFQDGSAKSYKISDIDEMNFTKSNTFSYMTIFRNNDTTKLIYDTELIEKLDFGFVTEGLMLRINYNGKNSNYYSGDIDSITFIEYEPNELETVTVCDQVWMTKNLDVSHYRNGEPIRFVSNYDEWIDARKKKEGAWCYYNDDPAYGATYGKLYNWYAVNDPRGLAPEGWHVPSKEEWKTLEMCLGDSTVAGGKLKSTGTIEDGTGLWKSPNADATNESGFSALPGGLRNYAYGIFQGIGEGGIWWSTSELYDKESWNWSLSTYHKVFLKSFSYKEYHFSVRCVKD